MSGSLHNEDPNLALFLAGPPRREKLSHRPPHTIVDALSKFELYWGLLRCVRVCTGEGNVGPKLETFMRDRDAREVSFCSFLDQLSRKLDESCTTVKIC